MTHNPKSNQKLRTRYNDWVGIYLALKEKEEVYKEERNTTLPFLSFFLSFF
jgi:hypothetical protein